MQHTRRPLALIAAALISTTCFTLRAWPQEAPRATAPTGDYRTRNVAIIVHEGVELLDFAGPGEVFEAASGRGVPPGGKPWFNVFTVAPSAGAIISQGFVRIEPQYTIDNCPKPDILVIPGGATGRLERDERFMNWVRDTAPQREISFSVCTGAFVYARLGLLDGRSATTHWSGIENLREDAPNVNVVENVRFVDSGEVITTAGVSAGIDGALHVVARLLGRETADQTARYMEYRWEPDPAWAAKYSSHNPLIDSATREHMNAMREAEALRQAKDWLAAITAYEALTKRYPDDANAWYLLGYCLHAAGEMDRAIEVHTKAATFEYRRERPLYNLACAYALKGHADQAFAALDEAISAGWNNASLLAQDSDWDSLRDDARLAKAIERMNALRTPR